MIQLTWLGFAWVASMVVAVTVGSLAAGGAATASEPASLEGSWSGSGSVQFPSGDKESVRCRARFTKNGGSSFAMTAVCATASARVEQTAMLSRTGPNRFSGDFQNAEYGVSGSILISVSGNSLSASMSGGGGSAQMRMSR